MTNHADDSAQVEQPLADRVADAVLAGTTPDFAVNDLLSESARGLWPSAGSTQAQQEAALPHLPPNAGPGLVRAAYLAGLVEAGARWHAAGDSRLFAPIVLGISDAETDQLITRLREQTAARVAQLWPMRTVGPERAQQRLTTWTGRQVHLSAEIAATLDPSLYGAAADLALSMVERKQSLPEAIEAAEVILGGPQVERVMKQGFGRVAHHIHGPMHLAVVTAIAQDGVDNAMVTFQDATTQDRIDTLANQMRKRFESVGERIPLRRLPGEVTDVRSRLQAQIEWLSDRVVESRELQMWLLTVRGIGYKAPQSARWAASAMPTHTMPFGLRDHHATRSFHAAVLSRAAYRETMTPQRVLGDQHLGDAAEIFGSSFKDLLQITHRLVPNLTHSPLPTQGSAKGGISLF